MTIAVAAAYLSGTTQNHAIAPLAGRTMTTKTKRYRERVRALNCAICIITGLADDTPAQTHHALDGAARSDYLLIPLCEPHHEGPNGFHGLGQRAFEARYGTTEANLLAWVNERLA